MREVRKNLLQAIIISAIVTGVLALYAYVPLILGDEKVILEMLWFPTIWSIGFFCISTMVLYVGLNEYRKTRKIWDGVRSALYWRAKVRMITFVGFVMFFLLYLTRVSGLILILRKLMNLRNVNLSSLGL